MANVKRLLAAVLAALLALAIHAPSLAGTGTEEEGSLYVFDFWPIRNLAYIARYGDGDVVVLGVDGAWVPERSIARQEALAEFNMLYFQPPASNDGYAPKRNRAVSETNRNNQIRFAQQIVPVLEQKFPTQRVALFGYSRGGWYLDELYKELKAHDREVVFAWCCDACPGDDKSIYGFPELEKDGIPIYVALSSGGAGKIIRRTKEYGESGNPAVVFFRQYERNHSELSAAVAEDLRDALRRYDPE